MEPHVSKKRKLPDSFSKSDECPVCHKIDGASVCLCCGFLHPYHHQCLDNAITGHSFVLEWMEERNVIMCCHECPTLTYKQKTQKTSHPLSYICLLCKKTCESLHCQGCQKKWYYHPKCLRDAKENSSWYGLAMDATGKKITCCDGCPEGRQFNLIANCDVRVCLHPTIHMAYHKKCLRCEQSYILHSQCLASTVDFSTVESSSIISECPKCATTKQKDESASEDEGEDLDAQINNPATAPWEPEIIRGFPGDEWKSEIVYRISEGTKKRAGAVCLEGEWVDHCFLCGSDKKSDIHLITYWIQCVCCYWSFLMCSGCYGKLCGMAKGMIESKQPHFCFWKGTFGFKPPHTCFPKAEHNGWRWYNEEDGRKGLMCYRCSKIHHEHQDPPMEEFKKGVTVPIYDGAKIRDNNNN